MDSATKNLQESQFRVNAMKKEQDTLLRGLNSMEKERQKFALLQKEQEQKVQKMEKDAQRVAGQMDGLRQEIGDLEKLSRKKDKQISDLQQSIEKVERHKSAMEAELKFLNERIQPKDSKIQELSGHLADAGREFVHKLKAEQSRDKQVEALKITIQHQTEAIKQSTRDKEDKDKYIQKFQRELYHAAHDTNEPKAALLTLRRMYQAYSGLYKGDEGGRMPSSGADEAEAVGVVEMDRQKRQLSRSLKKLSAKSDQQSEMGRVNNMRKIGENSLLIQEINELRKGQKNYLDKIKQLELMVKSLREGAAAPPRSSSAPRMPPISAGAATVQPSGLGTKAGLPNARAKAQLQEFASADGFPLMISMQNQR
ncbi:unnamed protein product [Amoebophrya sp. A25]|nr:unnamed protein product [Amoebophrya sp. A25]|eukprot:GSA25T00026523001.1